MTAFLIQRDEGRKYTVIFMLFLFGLLAQILTKKGFVAYLLGWVVGAVFSRLFLYYWYLRWGGCGTFLSRIILVIGRYGLVAAGALVVVSYPEFFSLTAFVMGLSGIFMSSIFLQLKKQ